MGWWKASSAERNEEARPQQNIYRVAPSRQTGAHECSGLLRRTTGTLGCHRLLRRSRTEEALVPRCLTFSQPSGRQATSQKEGRFLLNTQLIFLKKEKDPTSKQFVDDDEWIRSLTEAQEITADIPEDSVMYDQHDVDPKKVRPIQVEEFLRKCVSRRLLALSEGVDRSSHRRRCGNSEFVPKAALRLFTIFHQLFHDEWAEGSLAEPLARIKS